MNEEALRLVLRELEHAGVTPEQEQMLERLEERRITPEKELPQMEFLFRLFHRPCFPRGELVALSGKAKSGKTFVGTILMALCQRSPVLSSSGSSQGGCTYCGMTRSRARNPRRIS